MTQLKAARVLKREETDWGPWIEFWIAPKTPRVTPATFDVGDVDILFEEIHDSGGAIAFVRDGLLAGLEILADVPLDFHVRKVRFERLLENPDDPEGMPQFVVVERRAIDQLATNLQEARESEASGVRPHRIHRPRHP
jgi:hypothetical protein